MRRGAPRAGTGIVTVAPRLRYVLVSGYVAVSTRTDRVWFVAWYVLSVLTVFNVVVGAVLDSVVAEYRGAAAEEIDAAPVGRRRASSRTIDAASITGTPTGLSGGFHVFLDDAGAGATTPEQRRELLDKLLRAPADGAPDAAPGDA